LARVGSQAQLLSQDLGGSPTFQSRPHDPQCQVHLQALAFPLSPAEGVLACRHRPHLSAVCKLRTGTRRYCRHLTNWKSRNLPQVGRMRRLQKQYCLMTVTVSRKKQLEMRKCAQLPEQTANLQVQPRNGFLGKILRDGLNSNLKLLL